MSLNICFSSSTARLAGRLSRDIGGLYSDGNIPGRGVDPLRPVRIIVPNRNMEKWLRFTLSREGRVSFNLGFPYLEKGLWDLVGEIRVEQAQAAGMDLPDVEMAGQEALVSGIAAQIMADCSDPAHAGDVLAGYCRSGGASGSPGFCIRLWQLAGRLARLFREYEYSRSEMVREWLVGARGDRRGQMVDEQARLYRLTCGPGVNDVNSRGVTQVSLFRIAEDVFGEGRTPAGLKARDGDASAAASFRDIPVYVFGMSSLSRYHCQLFWDIARYREVHIYHVNNCHEYWEDVRTPAEERWLRVREATKKVGAGGDEELDFTNDLDENPLLKAWGRAGRETVRLLAELEYAGRAAVEWLEEPAELSADATVLQRVQHGIRERTSNVGRCCQDDSIEVWNCPGKLREVETIADRITGVLASDDTLRLSDIAVLVSDIGAYKPLIAQVFDRDKPEKGGEYTGPFPYNLADSNASADSLYAQAVKAILGLVGTDYSRKAVFDLLFNPCYQKRAGVSSATVDQWAALADKLGVFHDYCPEVSAGHAVDPGDSAEEGAPLKPFSWGQALVRLRLGRVMAADDGRVPDQDQANPFGRIYPSDGGGLDASAADSFSEKLEVLFSRLDGLRGRSEDATFWHRELKALFDDFLGIPHDRAAEALIRNSVQVGLDRYFGEGEGLDAGLRAAGAGMKIPSFLAFEVVRSLLGDIPTTKGAYLSDGITVASLKPMRPIPFRVVFVAGLEEGSFPGKTRESSLDLRAPGRCIGDVSTPDAGRYMFLETLLTVSEKLVITYDGWDVKKDARHEPCSVLRQLTGFISESVLAPDGQKPKPEFLVRTVPISPFGRGYLLADSPIEPLHRRLDDRAVACLVEAARLHRNDELKDICESAGSPENRKVLERVKAALNGSRIGRAADVARSLPGEPVTIKINNLATFLEDPMKARLRRYFSAWDNDDDETSQVEDEPFEPDNLTLMGLTEPVLRAVCAGKLKADAVDATVRSVGESMWLRSLFPRKKPFGDLTLSELSGDLVTAAHLVEQNFSGSTVRTKLPEESVSVVVDGVDYSMSLGEGVDFVVEPGASGLVGFGRVRHSNTVYNGNCRGLFPGFVYGMAACAFSDVFGTFDRMVLFEVSVAKGLQSKTIVTGGREAATAYMQNLIRDFMDDSMLLEHMPYAVAYDALGARQRAGAEPYPDDGNCAIPCWKNVTTWLVTATTSRRRPRKCWAGITGLRRIPVKPSGGDTASSGRRPRAPGEVNDSGASHGSD